MFTGIPVRDKLDLYYLPWRGIGISFFWVIRHTFTMSEYIARSKKLFNPKCNRSERLRDLMARVRFYCSIFKTATVVSSSDTLYRALKEECIEK